MAITKPPKLIKLADKSNCFIIINVSNADIGKDKDTTNEERISPKNKASSTITKIIAWPNALVIVLIAVFIKLERS